MGRPFNQRAYNACDMKNKKMLVSIMTKKGYVLIGDLEDEHYKKYDIKFRKGDKTISFENETRVNFTKIRDFFPTIHIPIRKKNTLADFYLVWKPEMDEFFLIKKDVIDNHKDKPVNLVCNVTDENNAYEDSFIDIPKEKAEHYKKINNKWKLIDKALPKT